MAPTNRPCGSGRVADDLDGLLVKNKAWAARKCCDEPQFFEKLAEHQHPEYLWIGCSDSRVPASQILGLAPGEIFVQRNVGNQASHTDLNVMSCLEYSVQALKVKNIIVCGHYNCGAVKAALQLPCNTPGLVNCWISGIRDCRNNHEEELREVKDPAAQVDLLCELNVKKQVFQVATSPVVQGAWSNGQRLNVYGIIYSLKDGLIKKLVGPINSDDQLMEHDEEQFVNSGSSFVVNNKAVKVIDVRSGKALRLTGAEGTLEDSISIALDTQEVVDQLQSHLSWAASVGKGKKK